MQLANKPLRSSTRYFGVRTRSCAAQIPAHLRCSPRLSFNSRRRTVPGASAEQAPAETSTPSVVYSQHGDLVWASCVSSQPSVTTAVVEAVESIQKQQSSEFEPDLAIVFASCNYGSQLQDVVKAIRREVPSVRHVFGCSVSPRSRRSKCMNNSSCWLAGTDVHPHCSYNIDHIHISEHPAACLLFVLFRHLACWAVVLLVQWKLKGNLASVSPLQSFQVQQQLSSSATSSTVYGHCSSSCSRNSSSSVICTLMLGCLAALSFAVLQRLCWLRRHSSTNNMEH